MSGRFTSPPGAIRTVLPSISSAFEKMTNSSPGPRTYVAGWMISVLCSVPGGLSPSDFCANPGTTNRINRTVQIHELFWEVHVPSSLYVAYVTCSASAGFLVNFNRDQGVAQPDVIPRFPAILEHFLTQSKKADSSASAAVRGGKPCNLWNWEAGIRTPISRVRVCCPTVGRPPKELSNQRLAKTSTFSSTVSCAFCCNSASGISWIVNFG